MAADTNRISIDVCIANGHKRRSPVGRPRSFAMQASIGVPRQFRLAGVSSGQLKSFAPRPIDQLIGLVVVNELLIDRIPMQLATEFANNVRQMARRHGAMADLDGSVGLLATLPTGQSSGGFASRVWFHELTWNIQSV